MSYLSQAPQAVQVSKFQPGVNKNLELTLKILHFPETQTVSIYKYIIERKKSISILENNSTYAILLRFTRL